MDLRSAEKMRALRTAQSVIRTVKGGYLEQLGGSVSLSGAYLPDLRYFCRIGGFRLTGDEASAERLWNRAAASWFGCTGARSVTSAYILAKDRAGLSVYYGAEQRIAETPFSGIPECSVTEEAWDVRRPYPFTGVVTGTLAGRHLADLYASSPMQDGYIACVVFPVTDGEIQNRISTDRQLESFLAQYRSVRHVYGTQTQRVEEEPVPEIEEAIALLKEERETMEASQEGGYVRTCIRFGAMTEEDFRSTASVILSAVHASDQTHGWNRERRGGFQPVRVFAAAGTCRAATECLAVPCVEIRAQDPVEGYREFRCRFACDERFYTEFCFRPKDSVISIDRKFSGQRRAIIRHREAGISHENGRLSFRMILDRYSAEVFVNGGEKVMTVTLETPREAEGISFHVKGKAILNIKKYRLEI